MRLSFQVAKNKVPSKHPCNVEPYVHSVLQILLFNNTVLFNHFPRHPPPKTGGGRRFVIDHDEGNGSYSSGDLYV